MTAQVTITTYDRLNKVTSMGISAIDAVATADVQALADAIDAIIRGVPVRATTAVTEVVDPGSAGPATDKEANRGSKWLFRTQDSTTNKIATNEIGTADGSVLPTADSDFLDLTTGVGLALKTAWEVVYRSDDGNTGVLLSVQQVNRALN